MSATQVALLKQFVELCRANPDLLYQPSMAFYKEYLESMGATIPPPSSGRKSSEKSESATEKPSSHYEEQEEDEPEIPKPELDESGVLEDKSDDQPLAMGDTSKQVSDEDLEKANEYRDMAMAAFSDGDYAKALEYFTKAIELNPGSAILHAKRANTLLKLSKLTAAIRDCDEAISVNPDSAQGYKFRGRAHRLLGHWIEAHQDLAMACKLDYDDTANEWLKEVEPNAKKLQEYNRAKERRIEEKGLRERRERVKKAQEANRKVAEESAASETANEGEEGDSDAAGGFPFAEMFQDDPEMVQMLKEDPSLLMKVLEIMQNPADMMKHMGDPAIRKLITKLGAKMGGGAGMFSGFNAGDSNAEGPGTADETIGSENKPSTQAKKNPEPDLD